MSGFNSARQAAARDLKHRVLTCLHKLSDRDTHSAAASDLESIAVTLSSDELPLFLSSISATDSSDKSLVRRHCVKLISVLADHHKNALSPYLSKILSAVVRRLRDHDSAVRSACVAASLSISTNLTSPPFTSIAKPFLESVFTEQDQSAQTGAASCLAAVIEGSRHPDAASLRRLLPRLEKLARSEIFKAKSALIALIGSVVGVKGVLSSGGENAVRNSVTCLMESLSSEDWAARKAAAEALVKIAAVESQSLSEYKLTCLKTFEAKRFDKVKAARETMNQLIDVWKGIPDLLEDASFAHESDPSPEENATNGRYPPSSKASYSIKSSTPQLQKRTFPDNNTTPRTQFPNGSPSSTAKKTSPIRSNRNKTPPTTAMFRKLDRKKSIETSDHNGSSSTTSISNNRERKQFEKPEIRRALFNESKDKQKCGMFNMGSGGVPCCDTRVFASDEDGYIRKHQTEREELSLIRKQLLQIENQQSNLSDLLQKFIGSSQNGMNSLETRVHGLELALEEISFDLAVSTGRMTQNKPTGSICCRLPGTGFFSSKFWRKSASRIPVSSGTQSTAVGSREVGNSRFSFQGNRGVIVNPLAKIPSGFTQGSSSGVNNISI